MYSKRVYKTNLISTIVDWRNFGCRYFQVYKTNLISTIVDFPDAYVDDLKSL